MSEVNEQKPKPVFIDVNLQDRKYNYPDGSLVCVADVVKISVSKSGTHRLVTQDGLWRIVLPGWHDVEIDAHGAEWTF